MTQVLHQLIASYSPYDAVSREALELRTALRDLGFESELYAEHVPPGSGNGVRWLSDLHLNRGEGVVLHYSIWSACVETALAAEGPVILRYHNVTPPEWFEGVNPVVAELCRRARQRLPALAGSTRLALADSEFNRKDLLAAGYERTAVLPLLLADASRRPSRANGASPLVLTVGRIVPNKRIDEIVRVFALFQRVCAPNARLRVVGPGEGFEPYETACRALADRLGARDVVFTGVVSEEEKERLYEEASAYLCLSEHEGFCVPVVEAMRFGLPVLARARGALPETLGAGGLAVETGDRAELSELLHLLVSEGPTRDAVIAGQERELARFDPAETRRRLAKLLEEALP